MKHIFITYGDDKYYFARLRLGKQARCSGLFDKVKVYKPKDLPAEITKDRAEIYKQWRGGGFWIWKPWIVRDALEHCDYGDIVWYADSGCAINPDSEEWMTLFAALNGHDSIFHAYRDNFDYHWERWGINSVKLRHWTKPLAREFMNEYYGSDAYLDMPSLWSGFMAVRKTENIRIINEWLRLTMDHPEIVCDPRGEELNSLPEDYNAHRHDQSVLSCIVRKLADEDNALVLDETAESRIGNPAIVAERYRAGKTSFWPDLKTRIYYLFHDR